MDKQFPLDASIIDEGVKHLIAQLNEASSPNIIDQVLENLIQVLDQNCQKPGVIERYQQVSTMETLSLAQFTTFPSYPLDEDGYAIAYDPVDDEDGFWSCWQQYGFVIGKSVVSSDICHATIARIHEILHKLSQQQFDLNHPETYGAVPVDSQNVSCLSRGFFEVYHDQSLAQLRQAVRIYLHHVVIWGRVDLWTSFDRLGIKIAGHEESKGLPLHVDQNPLVQPHFETIQGVLALTDCPVERGTFCVVPGSKALFPEYRHLVEARGDNYRGEYVEAVKDTPLAEIFYRYAQAIPIRAGDLISWDSRTTHANTPNLSDTHRMVAYIAAGPARENNPDAIRARHTGFTSGTGSNVRNALMHASMPPRYTHPETLQSLRQNETLTYLGKRLYGVETYASSLSRFG